MGPDQIKFSIEKQFHSLVTIVTPSFNQGQFIEETILSILNQTYKNIQYIIVDGDSSDKTMEVVNKYRDQIEIIIHEKDKGQSDAINKGFRLAKGELVGWINSDDILYPDCLEKIVELFKNKPDGAIFYGSKSNFIDEKSNIFKLNVLEIPNREYLLNKNYSIIQPGSFYSTFLVRKCNYLNENLNFCMDLDLWLRMLKYGSIYHYNLKPLAGFRFWGETKTMNGRSKFLREIRKTLLKHGANPFSPNIWRTYWQEAKDVAKRIIETIQ
jgi:glycosyltransferase involved in cell wall biosynthesis